MKYLWTGIALKEFFFFECLYLSEYDIRMLLFVIWFRNRQSIKYIRNWGNGGEVIQNVCRCVQREGSWKICHKIIRTTLQKILWNIFCALVWPSTLEHHRHQKSVVVFFHRNYNYFILCDNWNLVSFYIPIFTEKVNRFS